MTRPLPERTPPKFKVGDRVLASIYKRSFVTTVLSIKEMNDEWLVRTAYAAGFYTYEIDDEGGGDVRHVSGNLLELAVIDTLGGLADG